MFPSCFDMSHYKRKISCQTFISFPKAFFSCWLCLRDIGMFLTILQSSCNPAKTVKYVNRALSTRQTAPTAATSHGLELLLDCVPVIWHQKIFLSAHMLVSNVHELSSDCDSFLVRKTEKWLTVRYLIYIVICAAVHMDVYIGISNTAIFILSCLGSGTFVCEVFDFLQNLWTLLCPPTPWLSTSHYFEQGRSNCEGYASFDRSPVHPLVSHCRLCK